MTEEEKRMVRILYQCSFLPASFDKRFVKGKYRHLQQTPDKPLTEKGHNCLVRLFHRYRRQHKACTCLECFREASKKDQPYQTELFGERGEG